MMIHTITDDNVKRVFSTYPQSIRIELMNLRQLIFETSLESNEIHYPEETLKWGDPSYLVKDGSTVRLGWKKSTPNQFGIYFHCQTKLVDTFRTVYKDIFTFEGNRAIIFELGDEIPAAELKHCIMLALTYHNRKNLPMLGV